MKNNTTRKQHECFCFWLTWHLISTLLIFLSFRIMYERSFRTPDNLLKVLIISSPFSSLKFCFAWIIPTVGNQLPAFLPQRVEAVEILWTLLDQRLWRGGRLVFIIFNIYHGLVFRLIVWLVDLNLDLKIFNDGS